MDDSYDINEILLYKLKISMLEDFDIDVYYKVDLSLCTISILINKHMVEKKNLILKRTAFLLRIVENLYLHKKISISENSVFIEY